MNFYNLQWWLIIIINLIGYLIFLFGLKSIKVDFLRKHISEAIEFIGGVMVLISFIAMFWIFGIRSGLILIPIFWFVTTPISRLLIKI
jgi:cellobiose-specific phosphotransferase system component IIC